jgi:endonuclease YncB( thermonuclease family)
LPDPTRSTAPRASSDRGSTNAQEDRLAPVNDPGSVGADADDEDLGAWLVRAGLAIAYRKYSTVYVDDEDAARRARRGLWAGEFVEPSQWRGAHAHAQ